MYAITGITGHVGGAVATTLLQHGLPIRALVRDGEKGAPWAARGADVAVADLGDRLALADALRGAEGAFVMLPTLPSGTDADHDRLVGSIAAAVAVSGVPHVVALSSWGAELADGNGPIRWLHRFEEALRATGATVTAVRACHFQEAVEPVLGAVLDAGVLPVFGDDVDRPVPMVATCDVGALAAELLQAPPRTHQVVAVEGPVVTDREIGAMLAAELRREVQVVPLPRSEWEPTLQQAGTSAALAAEIAGLYDADLAGVLQPHGDRRVVGSTPPSATIRDLLTAAVSAA
ncbi:MAG TPA: NmrA family NAD(P)-binding protein [Actinotalea caeni]|nr:NmrA family NAD(P)-binding protein [Actinotalea caeni]